MSMWAISRAASTILWAAAALLSLLKETGQAQLASLAPVTRLIADSSVKPHKWGRTVIAYLTRDLVVASRPDCRPHSFFNGRCGRSVSAGLVLCGRERYGSAGG